jgi:hypothetical protein
MGSLDEIMKSVLFFYPEPLSTAVRGAFAPRA